MKLVVNKDLKNNAYEVELQVLDITDTDKEKISDFGEPVVNVGGVLTKTEEAITYEPIKVPQVTITEVPRTETQQKAKLDGEGNPVFEEDGLTPVVEDVVVPVLDNEGVQIIDTITTPNLDENGEPILIDKIDEQGKTVFQEVRTPIQEVVADLGTVLRKFPSEFPLRRSFTVAEFGKDTKSVALGYVGLIRAELEKAIDSLEQRVDDFSGREEIQL